MREQPAPPTRPAESAGRLEQNRWKTRHAFPGRPVEFIHRTCRLLESRAGASFLGQRVVTVGHECAVGNGLLPCLGQRNDKPCSQSQVPVLAVHGKPLHPLLAATGAIRRYSVLPSAYRPGSVNPLIRATVSLSTCVVPPFVPRDKRDYFVLSGTTRNPPEGIPVGGAGHLALFGLLWELNQGGAGGTRTPGLHSAIVALSQLSYSPVPMRRRIRMELMGLEPMTSTMPLWRSPN